MKTKRFYLNLSSRIIREIASRFPSLKVTLFYKQDCVCILEISSPDVLIFSCQIIEFIRSFGYQYYISLTTNTLNIDLTEKL